MNKVVNFKVERAVRKSGIKDKAQVEYMIQRGYDPCNPADVAKFWKNKNAADTIGAADFDLIDFDAFMENIQNPIVTIPYANLNFENIDITTITTDEI
jgi:hypothetical protein